MDHHQTEPGTHKHQQTPVSTDKGCKAATEHSTLYSKLTESHKQHNITQHNKAQHNTTPNKDKGYIQQRKNIYVRL